MIEAVGWVDDLATVSDRVRLTVAPLSYGAGGKGKVLDSLAVGVLCVCTPAAAEGLNLPEPLMGLVAEIPAGLAHSIAELHEDEALNRACTDAGLPCVADWPSERRLDRLMEAVTGRYAMSEDAFPAP